MHVYMSDHQPAASEIDNVAPLLSLSRAKRPTTTLWRLRCKVCVVCGVVCCWWLIPKLHVCGYLHFITRWASSGRNYLFLALFIFNHFSSSNFNTFIRESTEFDDKYTIICRSLNSNSLADSESLIFTTLRIYLYPTTATSWRWIPKRCF